MVDVDQGEIVILIVGNKPEDKRVVVESIMRCGAWAYRTMADVRILSFRSTGGIVFDTTPLENISGKSPTAIARRWIARNALRRILLGKLVFVVCVIPPTIKDTCKWKTFSYNNCWVDVFGLIFKRHQGGIMMLVNTEGMGDVKPAVTKAEFDNFVVEHGFSTKNIMYSNLKEGDDSVSRVIAGSIRLSQIPHDGGLLRRQPSLSSTSRRQTEETQNRNTGEAPHPFVTPFVVDVSSDKERFGPWGPERVILVGRTGSGKSTLAQMLTRGALDPHNEKFMSSSAIRGGTSTIEHGEGRGWYVLDTPGFGQPKGADSVISTHKAEEKIKNYVKLREGTFSHYVYVVKKDRLDVLDERLWTFFLRLFGEEIKLQFSVVVSNADEQWVRANLTALRKCFKECESFLSAYFPPIDEDDEEAEEEFQNMRKESLQELEESLARLSRVDRHCSYGKKSKMHGRNEWERANVDMGIQKDLRIQVLTEGAKAWFAVRRFMTILKSPISEWNSILTVDENIALLPA